MEFNSWIDTFIEEKGYDLEHQFSIDKEGTCNIMSLACVVNSIKNKATDYEKSEIKDMLVRIDFRNGDCLHYFAHLGKAVAVTL